MIQPPFKRPPNEIEGRPFRDYKPLPMKGEPFMAPGGWIVLIGFLGAVTFGAIYSHYGRMVLAPIVEPSVDWLMSFVR